MVLDASALVAIILLERGHERLLQKIEEAESVLVGAPTVMEAAMVLSTRLGQDSRPPLLGVLSRMGAVIIAFNEEHMNAAVRAFLRYGRGRHPAALNFGDCLSYAIASVAGLPLLFVGEDFARTDIIPA